MAVRESDNTTSCTRFFTPVYGKGKSQASGNFIQVTKVKPIWTWWSKPSNQEQEFVAEVCGEVTSMFPRSSLAVQQNRYKNHHGETALSLVPPLYPRSLNISQHQSLRMLAAPAMR